MVGAVFGFEFLQVERDSAFGLIGRRRTGGGGVTVRRLTVRRFALDVIDVLPCSRCGWNCHCAPPQRARRCSSFWRLSSARCWRYEDRLIHMRVALRDQRSPVRQHFTLDPPRPAPALAGLHKRHRLRKGWVGINRAASDRYDLLDRGEVDEFVVVVDIGFLSLIITHLIREYTRTNAPTRSARKRLKSREGVFVVVFEPNPPQKQGLLM